MLIRGRDSSVSLVTRHGLDGPGIESLSGGVRFSAPVQTCPGTHPASYTMGTGSFLGVKRPGRGVDKPLPSSAEIEGRVELYAVGSKSFRPDIQKPRQMENAVRDI